MSDERKTDEPAPDRPITASATRSGAALPAQRPAAAGGGDFGAVPADGAGIPGGGPAGGDHRRHDVPVLSLACKRRLGERENLASLLTILLLLFGVVVPLAGFLTLVVTESVSLSQSVSEWVQQQPDWLNRARECARSHPSRRIASCPRGKRCSHSSVSWPGVPAPCWRARWRRWAAARSTSRCSCSSRSTPCSSSWWTGREFCGSILYYIPLGSHEEQQLLDRFVSVTRATLRGSLLIGVIQGALAGVAFWVCGVPAPAFWGTVTIVMSIIPAVGGAFIWVPAVLYLAAMGQVPQAIGLFVWCAVVVSTVDNFLRPRLIGRDARMSDLLILLSTLGGISVFGALGFIVGPIIAALFVTVWHIYGQAFEGWLPRVPPAVLTNVGKPEALED